MMKDIPGTETVVTPCPVCGSERFFLRYRFRGDLNKKINMRGGIPGAVHHSIVECIDCGVSYACPRDSDGILAEIYSSSRLSDYLREQRSKEKMFNRQFDRIESWSRGKGKLLELGCAAGLLCRIAVERGWEAVGCDSWKEAVEYGRGRWNLDLRVIDANFRNKIEGKFDAIVLWDTIEHLSNPKLLLSDLREMLKEDGILALSTPDYGSLSRRLLGSRWQFFERTHLVYFSRKTLMNLLRSSGFRVLECRGQTKVVSLGYLIRYLGKWSMFLSLLLRRIIDKMYFADLLLRLPGGMMIAYASKIPTKEEERV